jgi:signal transduction histidine kinase
MNQEWYEKRISFLEEENQRTLIALDEITTFESYFTNINENTDINEIYHVTCSHLKHFVEFETIAFMDIRDDMTFNIGFCQGKHDFDFIKNEVNLKIESRFFAQALSDKCCISSPSSQKGSHIVLHCLYSKTKILGMFIGVHKENILETATTVAPLLSVLLRKTGHFLSLLQKYKRLHSEVTDLQLEVQKKNFALDDAIHKASFLEVARKQMLANISHEFRTPLNAIIGLLDLMRDSENLTQEYRDYISTASNSASLIISLIDDLLLYVKLKSSPALVSAQPGSLSEVLQSLVSQEEIVAQTKGLSIKLSFSPSIEQLLILDGKLLFLALQKLCSNAIKFTQAGSIFIKANVINDKSDLLEIHFKIIDSGIGLNVENLEFLCQPFTQQDTSTTRNFEGMGMGLALASLIVESLGGALKVESSPSKGSTFSFKLKFSKVAKATTFNL